VSVGQKVCSHVPSHPRRADRDQAIKDRIQELHFQDTKVRVTNVDSQGSDANIVIQVIGEISNKGLPHRRFAQTFVLAEQTNGYFVLNDIFRYLTEEPEEDEEPQNDIAPTNGVKESAPTTVEPAQLSQDATSEEIQHKGDDQLDESAQAEPNVEAVAPAAPVEQIPEEIEAPAAEEVPAAVTEEAPQEPEAPAEEKAAEPEQPKEPASTPTPSANKAAPVATPSGPPKPRTWASLAASANKVATPIVAQHAAQQAPSQSKAAAPTQPALPAAAPSAQTPAPAREQSPAASQGETAGWQSVTANKKEQSRPQNQGPAADPNQTRAYIKNVYSQVEESALKEMLSKFGEVTYLDVSRAKVSCEYLTI